MKTQIDYEEAAALAPLGDAINKYAARQFVQSTKPPEDLCLQIACCSGTAYLRFVTGSAPEPTVPAHRKQVGWYVECDIWSESRWVTQKGKLWDDFDKELFERRSAGNPTYRNIRIRPAWVEA